MIAMPHDTVAGLNGDAEAGIAALLPLCGALRADGFVLARLGIRQLDAVLAQQFGGGHGAPPAISDGRQARSKSRMSEVILLVGRDLLVGQVTCGLPRKRARAA